VSHKATEMKNVSRSSKLETRRHQFLTFLRITILVLGVFFIGAYLFVAVRRAAYPFELEWVEGGFLDLLTRFNEGRSLYQQPTLEFAPYIGMPFFIVVAGLFAKFFGSSFTLLRMISILASLGTAGLIYISLRREHQPRFYAFLGVAFFASVYAVTGAWYDLARVDSVFVFLMMLAIYILRFYGSWKTEFLAALTLALAVLTKQTAVIVAPFLFLACLFINPKRGWVFALSFAGILSAVFLALNRISQGWFWFYVFNVPTFHNVYPNQLLTFFTEDSLPILLSFIFVAAYFGFSYHQRLRTPWIFPLAFFAGALMISWSGRAVSGAFINHLIPLCASLALIVPSALSVILEDPRNKRWQITSLILILCQLLVLLYNPLKFIPTLQDQRTGEQIVVFLETIEGDVFIPMHPYLAELAGKPGYAHLARFGEVLGFYGAQVPKVGHVLRVEFEQAIKNGRFAAILLDDKAWMLSNFPTITEYYLETQFIDFENPSTFRTVSGISVRPQFLFIRKSNP
jgi:hypothetical protein